MALESTQQDILGQLREIRNLLVEIKDLLDEGLPAHEDGSLGGKDPRRG